MQQLLTPFPGGGLNVILDSHHTKGDQMVFGSVVLRAQESCRRSKFLSQVT